MSNQRPALVCLDMEGVLTPEIWFHVAQKTGIEALRVTTRDEPDYDKLMKGRIAILKERGLRLSDIQALIRTLKPLDGAAEFLTSLRAQVPVVVLSDTFYPFVGPLMEQLGFPTLFCNTLEVDAQGVIQGYHLRLPDQKRASVRALKQLHFRVIAAGDSYNDATMLTEADPGILFRPPETVAKAFPQFPVTTTYADLEARIYTLTHAATLV